MFRPPNIVSSTVITQYLDVLPAEISRRRHFLPLTGYFGRVTGLSEAVFPIGWVFWVSGFPLGVRFYPFGGGFGRMTWCQRTDFPVLGRF